MKKIVLILSLIIVSITAYCQSTLVAGQQTAVPLHRTDGTTGTGTRVYIYLPWDYYVTTNKYPIIFFWPGNNGVGNGDNDMPKLLTQDLPYQIDNNNPPYAVKANGDTVQFIVTTYQPSTTSGINLAQFSNWVSTIKWFGLNVDTTRMYYMGASQGAGVLLSNAAGTLGWVPAAAVSINPAFMVTTSQLKTDWQNIPIWFFQDDNDQVVGQNGTTYYNSLHSAYPDGPHKLTQFVGAHNGPERDALFSPAWSDDTSTRTVPAITGTNIYGWAYQYGGQDVSTPTVNAGSDQVLSAGTTSATLSGSATTPNGSIVSYQWTTTSGATITSPTSASTTVTGLEDNHTYTFTLTVTDDSSMTASDDVNITVKEGEVIPDTASYQIILSPGTKFWNGDTVFYQLNNLNNQDSAANIIDEQTGTPYSTFFYKAQGAHGNLIVVIDLGGYYKLTNVQMFANYGTAPLFIEYGKPLNWSTDTIKVGSGAGRFGYYDTPTSIYTRYLRLSYGSGNQKFKEMRLYGYLVRDSLSRTEPVADLVKPTSNTMGQFIGFNQVGPNEVDSVGQLMRHYLQNEWVDTTKATGTHNIDSLKFVFNVHTTWKGSYSPTYYFFPYTAGDGPVKTSTSLNWGDYFDAFQGPPVYLSGTNLYKPIDTAIFHQRDPLNPHQYTRLSRMAWTYAAMLGKNTYPEDSMQTPYPDLSGLDRRKYIENGNEYNGSWKTGDDHFTPQEFVAYSSAFYDGDNSTMGNRMGIKNADPDMQVVMGGTAGADTAYLKGLQYYSYYTRKNKSVPFDIVNFHTYPTNGSNGTGTDAHAYSPEQYFGRGQIQAYMKVAKTVMPDKPVWLTEWGYDRNGKSSLSVPPISGLDSAQVQAQWIARWWFLLSFSGIDRSTIFQLHNDALSTMYDSVGTSVPNTTGLTDGHYVGNEYSSEYATSYYAYPAYYFQRAIWLKLYNYKPDSIVYNNHDSIWVYRYRNVDDPDSVAYAVWSGTQTNRSTDAYSLKTGHANTTVSFTKLEDKQMDGVTSTPTSDADGNLPLVISETPVMVFTTEGVNGGQLVESEEPINTPPTANAGADQGIRLPVNSVTLKGSANAGTGAITSHVWSKLSGGQATINSPGSYTTSVTGMEDGTYAFRLIVTDENSLSDTDDVQVIVNPAYIPPTASAGEDQTLSAGTTSATLSGTAEGNGGATITSYHWTQVAGDATIVSPDSQSTDVTGLTDGGAYQFRLTVTDNHGLIGNDDVVITVNEQPLTPSNLKFKWVYYTDGFVILVFQDQSTGKLYSIKLKNQ